jgi:peptidoglycan/LPS O-acetylase OafA/YrhL
VNQAIQAQETSDRFEALDACRGIAALAIAIYHFLPRWGGYLAVDFFFILSGFVLARTYLYRDSPIGLREFTGRRLARLYPYHLFTLLVFLLLQLFSGRGLPSYEDGTFVTFLQQTTLTHNIGLNPKGLTWNYPSWSVSVEFWVNILFALFITRNSRTSMLLILPVIGLGVIYVNTGHLETQADNYFGFLNSGMVRGLFEFLLGVLTYRIYLQIRGNEIWKANQTPIEMLAVTGLLFVLFARDGKLSVLDFGAPFVFMLVVAVFAGDSGCLSRRMKGLKYLGTISYSLYLNQVIVLTLVWQWLPAIRDSTYARLAFFLLVLVIVSHFTYRFVERPLRTKIRSWFATGYS